MVRIRHYVLMSTNKQPIVRNMDLFCCVFSRVLPVTEFFPLVERSFDSPVSRLLPLFKPLFKVLSAPCFLFRCYTSTDGATCVSCPVLPLGLFPATPTYLRPSHQYSAS